MEILESKGYIWDDDTRPSERLSFSDNPEGTVYWISEYLITRAISASEENALEKRFGYRPAENFDDLVERA